LPIQIFKAPAFRNCSYYKGGESPQKNAALLISVKKKKKIDAKASNSLGRHSCRSSPSIASTDHPHLPIGMEYLSSVVRAGLYFAVLLGAFFNVLIQWSVWGAVGWRRLYLLALPFSLVAWYITWTLIFRFFGEQTVAFNCGDANIFTCDSAEYLASPNIFVEAYVQVTNTRGGYFWSAQLLTWVGPGCTFLYIEAKKYGGRISKGLQLSYLLLVGTKALHTTPWKLSDLPRLFRVFQAPLA
jgi:hypothetical protein